MAEPAILANKRADCEIYVKDMIVLLKLRCKSVKYKVWGIMAV